MSSEHGSKNDLMQDPAFAAQFGDAISAPSLEDPIVVVEPEDELTAGLRRRASVIVDSLMPLLPQIQGLISATFPIEDVYGKEWEVEINKARHFVAMTKDAAKAMERATVSPDAYIPPQNIVSYSFVAGDRPPIRNTNEAMVEAERIYRRIFTAYLRNTNIEAPLRNEAQQVVDSLLPLLPNLAALRGGEFLIEESEGQRLTIDLSKQLNEVRIVTEKDGERVDYRISPDNDRSDSIAVGIIDPLHDATFVHREAALARVKEVIRGVTPSPEKKMDLKIL